MTAARRLAAILAADVVGYSRLMGEDETGTAQAVRERREASTPIVAGHGGRIVKTTGDGLLMEFPSVVAAVECAVAIQNMMAERNAATPEGKRIRYRIGVNLGDVLIDGDDILGDGVNIAARLEGIAEPGGVLISGAAYDHVRGRIDVDFVDLGEKTLKNIAQPVRVYALRVGDVARASASTPLRPADQVKPAAPALLGMAALLLVIAVGGGYWFIANRPAAVATGPPALASQAPAEAKHLSIVVLPFTNLSGDPSQDYFADGITENLTTDLSRIHNSFVIARNTAFTYKGKSVDAKEIGKELGVRYVLEGSVQRNQNRVRVNAQLVNAETGAHLWAERFEEDVADLFKLQDQVVARLANTLGNELVKAEAAKGARAKDPDAVDLTMRGRALLSPPWGNKAKNDAARALFEQVLKTDPDEADALAGEAATYAAEFQLWKNPETDYEARIIGQADRAIGLAPDSVAAYEAKAWYLAIANRWDEALRAIEAGLAINPNSARLYAARGYPEVNLGRFEQSRSDLQQAMRLSPRDPDIGWWHVDLGNAEVGLGHYDAAIEEFQKADNTGCCGAAAPLSFAVAYALAGKMDEAKSALAEARRREPKLTIKWLVENHAPSVLYKGLRRAGLAEE